MKRLIAYIGLLTLPFMTTLALAADNAGKTKTEQNDKTGPASYLKMTKEFSGKCMGLRRGDIRVLKNTHPDKTIEYRLVRMLSGHRQASIIQDTIKPGSEGHKLGCELLDDREQTWKVVRARFVE